MLFIQNAIKGIKTTVKRIINPDANRLAFLSRKRVEALINKFPEDEIILREDIRQRFEKALGKKIPENRSWLEIENLFESCFFRKNGSSYISGNTHRHAARELDYSTELLTKVMKCVGPGESLETKKAAARVS